MENFAEYDVGNAELVSEMVQDIEASGYDCASVDLLLRLAKDGDLESLADILSGLVSHQHPEWAGDLLKMVMQRGAEPDYVTPAFVLTYMVDTNPVGAHKLCPHLLVYQQHGPDCYDLALTLGHMAKSYKATQAAKVCAVLPKPVKCGRHAVHRPAQTLTLPSFNPCLLQLMLALYRDDSAQGQNLKALVPFLLGTLIDFKHADWAASIVESMCTVAGRSQPDYAAAGWCLAQQVFYQRSDWAASLCSGLQRQHSAWYNHSSMMQSVASVGGDGYVQSIMAAMA